MSDDDNKKNSQEKVIEFAVAELMKIVSDVQKGKTPKISPEIESLKKEVDKLASMPEDMTDEEIETWADNAAAKIGKKK